MRTDNPNAHPVSVCIRKKQYTEKTAERVAGRIRHRTGENVVAYGCTRCGWWHVGHPTEEDEA